MEKVRKQMQIAKPTIHWQNAIIIIYDSKTDTHTHIYTYGHVDIYKYVGSYVFTYPSTYEKLINFFWIANGGNFR